jgi:hypothetical protein
VTAKGKIWQRLRTPYLHVWICHARYFGLRCGRSAAGSQIERNVRNLRILISDEPSDYPKTRADNLGRATPIQVCGDGYDDEAIEEAQRLKPDVVVLNVSMSILYRMDAARKIKNRAFRDGNRNIVFACG